jgi:Lrp/AsnC family transcriptional regulator, leucine-responsive regulatory protein
VPRAVIDAIDHDILVLLAEDARRSATEIGRRVSLSPAAAKRRIDRLEVLGVIRGYHAVVDHARLGDTIEAFVELRFEAGTQVNDIEGAFSTLSELVAGFTLAGDPDALLHLRVADLGHLRQVIDRVRRSGSVSSTKTLIVLARSDRRSTDPS